uniref:Protein kinase domain-containing protein n=1 Tax=Physcomitrium patens TaxID=3218 RepID=A0A2K1IYD7_PHYPA|nr:hypothetical protein PHYPA_024105 [Physcomitrium patens]
MEYVVTRWYRAPELLFICPTYDTAVDVWSVGCILLELYLGAPLLQGSDYVNQILLIIELVGTPEDEDLHFLRDLNSRRYVKECLTRKPHVPFTEKFKDINPTALDLAEKMIVFNPAKRISDEEPNCGAIFEFESDISSVSVDYVKDCIWTESAKMNSNIDVKRQ